MSFGYILSLNETNEVLPNDLAHTLTFVETEHLFSVAYWAEELTEQA